MRGGAAFEASLHSLSINPLKHQCTGALRQCNRRGVQLAPGGPSCRTQGMGGGAGMSACARVAGNRCLRSVLHAHAIAQQALHVLLAGHARADQGLDDEALSLEFQLGAHEVLAVIEGHYVHARAFFVSAFGLCHVDHSCGCHFVLNTPASSVSICASSTPRASSSTSDALSASDAVRISCAICAYVRCDGGGGTEALSSGSSSSSTSCSITSG